MRASGSTSLKGLYADYKKLSSEGQTICRARIRIVIDSLLIAQTMSTKVETGTIADLESIRINQAKLLDELEGLT